jgi:hypothetical protein
MSGKSLQQGRDSNAVVIIEVKSIGGPQIGRIPDQVGYLHFVCSALEQNDSLGLWNGFDHALEVPSFVDLVKLTGSVDETANNEASQSQTPSHPADPLIAA